MSYFIKSIIVLIFLISSGCDSTKSSTSNEMNDQEKTSASIKQEMAEKGYVAGRFVFKEKGGCPVILETQDSKEQLDPVNMEEEKFSSFKQEGRLIYVKFRRLRMMNRCPDAAPIEITDIKLGQ